MALFALVDQRELSARVRYWFGGFIFTKDSFLLIFSPFISSRQNCWRWKENTFFRKEEKWKKKERKQELEKKKNQAKKVIKGKNNGGVEMTDN